MDHDDFHGGLKRAFDDWSADEQDIWAAYEDCRMIARALLRRECSALSISTTDLLHTAFGALLKSQFTWNDRDHLRRAWAMAMRRALIDRARARGAEKRGAGRRPLQLEDFALEDLRGTGERQPEAVIALIDEIDELRRTNPDGAAILELRGIGLAWEEISRWFDGRLSAEAVRQRFDRLKPIVATRVRRARGEVAAREAAEG